MKMYTANQIPKTEALPFVIMRVDDRRWERCSYASKRDISTYKEHKHKKGNNFWFISASRNGEEINRIFEGKQKTAQTNAR